MPVDATDLATAIHQQLVLVLLKDEQGQPVTPPPDMDTAFQRISQALATALVEHLVDKAVVLVSVPGVGKVSGTVS